MLARRAFLHVENVFSPTTQASGFAANPEFTPDVSSLACLSGAIERVIGIGSKFFERRESSIENRESSTQHPASSIQL